MKTAIVYDRVNKWGGAERVLLTLHEMFPDAPLYTSVYNPQGAPWASVFSKVVTSFLQKIPFAKDNHEFLSPLMPVAFESFNFDAYDLVISVTSEAAKGIITKPGTKHICYCLTPTRYLWSHYDTYFKDPVFKGTTKPVVSYLRTWDKISAFRPDEMIAISNAVRDRIMKYYNRESRIIYPPVNFPRVRYKPLATNYYYLVVSRLVPYKRVDLVIEVFNRLKIPLIVVGTGSEEKKLRGMAKDNVKFTGQLTEGELLDYYERCTALIMPPEEDFGIVAVEAQGFGRPVIAYKKGGALDTVIDGKTGTFFNAQSEESLSDAIKRFKSMKFNPDDCIDNAKRFSKERFKEDFLKVCVS